MASVWSCQHLCARIDPAYQLLEDGGHFSRAMAELQGQCLDAANLNLAEGVVRQKQLSALVDGALKAELRGAVRGEGARVAHLALVALPGAGAGLTAPPVDDGRDVGAGTVPDRPQAAPQTVSGLHRHMLPMMW